MEYDHERAEEKAEEICDLLSNVILKNCSNSDVVINIIDAKLLSNDIIKYFVSLVPPEKGPILIDFITVRTGGRGIGTSLKPGNMTLNLRKLFTAVATGILSIPGALSAPWTIPLSAIILWDIVWSGIKIEFSERDAAVIWTLWLHKNENKRVVKNGLLEKVNIELSNYERTLMSNKELEDSLEKLKNISCIKDKGDSWWLCEYIRVVYN
jgi:hypothetical protein